MPLGDKKINMEVLKFLKNNKICCTLIRDFSVETLKGWREKNNANEGIIFVFKCY